MLLAFGVGRWTEIADTCSVKVALVLSRLMKRAISYTKTEISYLRDVLIIVIISSSP